MLAQNIFLDALEVAQGPEREEFLRRACGADTELQQAVGRLFADHGLAEGVFAESESELLRLTAELLEEDLASGTSIGPYCITNRLGEGGSGVVYAAEQIVPVRREVALKLLKLGPDIQSLMERFAVERQTLAWLEHPNISRVIDAGCTGAGRPYFVMELVRGPRITEYCVQAKIGLADRIGLVLQVCAAVQHAHQKGIIHRDLKPANLLVSTVDGIPVVKVIDFGIALVGAVSAGPSASLRAGTPVYMSPEQREKAAGDVDTRSDIYSLGLLLAELVTGQLPKDDPQVWVLQHVHGDLGWILRRALERDRDRRYPNVKAFEQDLRRYLEKRPVEAHPPSRLYRLGMFVRRNRLASLASFIAVASLLAGLATSLLLYSKAREAEKQQARLRADAEERAHVSRAAILLMQGRREEADAEVESMGGPLMQPSLEATSVFRDLAQWSASKADWRTVARRLLALSRVNRFDESDWSDNATRDLLSIAPTLIECGDLAAYREFSERLLLRLGRTNNPLAAEHVLKILLHGPQAPSMLPAMESVAHVAQSSLSATRVPRDRLEAWRCAVLGLWHYRNGRYAEASAWARFAQQCPENELALQVYARLVESLALLRSGTGSVQGDLSWAKTLVEANLPPAAPLNRNGFWNDWLTAHLLLKEAEAEFHAHPDTPDFRTK